VWGLLATSDSVRSARALTACFSAAFNSKVLLVAIGSKIERARYFDQGLFLDSALMLFHEALIRPPPNAGGLDGVPLGAERDLVSMKVMRPLLIKQRFSVNLVRQQEISCRSSTRSLPVNTLAKGHCRELLVGGFLFVQVGVQKADDIIVAHCFGPGNQRPVASHFIVLNSLC
jgi:hypothetical protein